MMRTERKTGASMAPGSVSTGGHWSFIALGYSGRSVTRALYRTPAHNATLKHLHVDGDAGRKGQVGQGVHDFAVRVHYVHDALVGAHFELLARVFVDEG